MSYNTIHQCANDQAFVARITACAAEEGAAEPVPVGYHLAWPVATRSDIEAAYASALAAANPDPGGDESVITDGMILAAVQAELPNVPTTATTVLSPLPPPPPEQPDAVPRQPG